MNLSINFITYDLKSLSSPQVTAENAGEISRKFLRTTESIFKRRTEYCLRGSLLCELGPAADRLVAVLLVELASLEASNQIALKRHAMSPALVCT